MNNNTDNFLTEQEQSKLAQEVYTFVSGGESGRTAPLDSKNMSTTAVRQYTTCESYQTRGKTTIIVNKADPTNPDYPFQIVRPAEASATYLAPLNYGQLSDVVIPVVAVNGSDIMDGNERVTSYSDRGYLVTSSLSLSTDIILDTSYHGKLISLVSGISIPYDQLSRAGLQSLNPGTRDALLETTIDKGFRAIQWGNAETRYFEGPGVIAGEETRKITALSFSGSVATTHESLIARPNQALEMYHTGGVEVQVAAQITASSTLIGHLRVTPMWAYITVDASGNETVHHTYERQVKLPISFVDEQVSASGLIFPAVYVGQAYYVGCLVECEINNLEAGSSIDCTVTSSIKSVSAGHTQPANVTILSGFDGPITIDSVSHYRAVLTAADAQKYLAHAEMPLPLGVRSEMTDLLRAIFGSPQGYVLPLKDSHRSWDATIDSLLGRKGAQPLYALAQSNPILKAAPRYQAAGLFRSIGKLVKSVSPKAYHTLTQITDPFKDFEAPAEALLGQYLPLKAAKMQRIPDIEDLDQLFGDHSSTTYKAAPSVEHAGPLRPVNLVRDIWEKDWTNVNVPVWPSYCFNDNNKS